VPIIVVAPSTPAGRRSNALFNHYSLLRTTEEMLGITDYLGGARNAHSMRVPFNL
jgi:phosphatidylinositol-3-phosphatase